VVDESDPAVELGVAGQAFFDAGHADQDQADAGPVVVVAELFQRRCLEPVRLVDDQQLGARPAALAQRGEILRGLEFPLEPQLSRSCRKVISLSTMRGVLQTFQLQHVQRVSAPSKPGGLSQPHGMLPHPVPDMIRLPPGP
jgi:hypothetical protein